MIAERDRGLDLELAQIVDLLLDFHAPQELATGRRVHDPADAGGTFGLVKSGRGNGIAGCGRRSCRAGGRPSPPPPPRR